MRRLPCDAGELRHAVTLLQIDAEGAEAAQHMQRRVDRHRYSPSAPVATRSDRAVGAKTRPVPIAVWSCSMSGMRSPASRHCSARSAIRAEAGKQRALQPRSVCRAALDISQHGSQTLGGAIRMVGPISRRSRRTVSGSLRAVAGESNRQSERLRGQHVAEPRHRQPGDRLVRLTDVLGADQHIRGSEQIGVRHRDIAYARRPPRGQKATTRARRARCDRSVPAPRRHPSPPRTISASRIRLGACVQSSSAPPGEAQAFDP